MTPFYSIGELICILLSIVLALNFLSIVFMGVTTLVKKISEFQYNCSKTTKINFYCVALLIKKLLHPKIIADFLNCRSEIIFWEIL